MARTPQKFFRLTRSADVTCLACNVACFSRKTTRQEPWAEQRQNFTGLGVSPWSAAILVPARRSRLSLGLASLARDDEQPPRTHGKFHGKIEKQHDPAGYSWPSISLDSIAGSLAPVGPAPVSLPAP